MCLGKELSEYQKRGIISAIKLGHTNSEISTTIGCSRSSVIRVWKSYELKKLPKKRTGRPQILDKRAREQLKYSIMENKETRCQTLSQIRLNFIKDTNKSISIQTIRIGLAQEGLRSCIPRLKPLISKSNKEKHLQWAFKIRQCNSQPSNIVQLEWWVKEEWDAIPVNYYRNLIKSMPCRVQAILEANGGQTKY
ncbi:hypothetical protein G9A89_012581 [Geosiphon pyriformis]|nr:hypothetical protein G9A89_012581 [Geosiphon pyriformis]